MKYKEEIRLEARREATPFIKLSPFVHGSGDATKFNRVIQQARTFPLALHWFFTYLSEKQCKCVDFNCRFSGLGSDIPIYHCKKFKTLQILHVREGAFFKHSRKCLFFFFFLPWTGNYGKAVLNKFTALAFQPKTKKTPVTFLPSGMWKSISLLNGEALICLVFLRDTCSSQSETHKTHFQELSSVQRKPFSLPEVFLWTAKVWKLKVGDVPQTVQPNYGNEQNKNILPQWF